MRRWALGVSIVATLGCSSGVPAWMSGSEPSSRRVEVAAEDKYDPSLDTVHVAHKKRPPAIPAGTLLQVFDTRTGEFDRFDEKGQMRHGDRDGHDNLVQVKPKGESKRNRMTAEGLGRFEAALAAADLVHQPALIEPTDVPEGAVLELLAFTVPHPSGSTITVEVKADRGDPSTFGPLKELWEVLREEAYGVPE